MSTGRMNISYEDIRVIDRKTGLLEISFTVKTARGQSHHIQRAYGEVSLDGTTIKILGERLSEQLRAELAVHWAETHYIGDTVVKGGAKGHAIEHGTKEDKLRRWAEYQRYIDDRHRRYPSHSYNALMSAAKDEFGKSFSTIKRHTNDPKKS